MPFLQSQFSLSLELTRLIPASAALLNASWADAISFARRLQDSGSDFITEEDLVNKFGAAPIASSIAGSFRDVLGKRGGMQSYDLVEAGMSLFPGLGPTLTRALTEGNNGPYFAMVVQCE